MVSILAGVVFALLPQALQGQPAPGSDPLAPLAVLIGTWEGTTAGQPGRGIVRREYSRALNDRFIRVRNRSEYPSRGTNLKGEVQDDEGWFSFDRGRKRLVLRQFHVEGFVNQYVEEPGSSATRLVFTTEAIENIPAGWRARETYVLKSPDAFEEIFELAESGKPFEVYSRSSLKRVR